MSNRSAANNSPSPSLRPGIPMSRVGSLLCLFLLAIVTFVQVGHVHPATSTDSDNCPICVVMHSAAPVAVIAAAIVFVTASTPVPVPVLHSVVRPWHCTLFNRPPPTEA